MRSASSRPRLPAVAGYPHLTVPMGQVRGLPVGPVASSARPGRRPAAGVRLRLSRNRARASRRRPTPPRWRAGRTRKPRSGRFAEVGAQPGHQGVEHGPHPGVGLQVLVHHHPHSRSKPSTPGSTGTSPIAAASRTGRRRCRSRPAWRPAGPGRCRCAGRTARASRQGRDSRGLARRRHVVEADRWCGRPVLQARGTPWRCI